MGFLYGASVQGIQKFVFETNKLKEIEVFYDIISTVKQPGL